jgi:hypothetical protein
MFHGDDVDENHGRPHPRKGKHASSAPGLLPDHIPSPDPRQPRYRRGPSGRTEVHESDDE